MQSAFVRFGASFAIAAVATFAVFWVMQSLISSSGSVVNTQEYARIESFIMEEPDDEVRTKEQKVKKPPTPPQEPPPPDMPKPDVAKASTDGFDLGGFDIEADLNLDSGLGGAAVSDGEYLPIFKVAPRYPQRAANRGIEGYVVVEFTVTKLGTVSNPRVVEADPPGVFDRAALKAAARFKYKPKVADGQPIEVPGVRNIIRFELEKK